jgi:hypothetical protein
MVMRLTRVAIPSGRQPAVWKWASGVLIRKPGKDDYRMLMANHSISLLSCMGKVVTKVFTNLLSEEASRR